MVFSCSITKRYHNKGLHIEWRKNYWNKKQVVQAKVDTTNQSIAVVSDEIPTLSHTSDNVEITAFQSVNNLELVVSAINEQRPSKNHHIKRLQNKSLNQQVKENKPNHLKKEQNIQRKPTPETSSEKPKVELFTWITIGIIGVALLFLVILLLSLSIPILLLSLTFYATLLTVLAVLFVITSYTSIVRILINPKKYKAKWLSWIFFGFATYILIYFTLALIFN